MKAALRHLNRNRRRTLLTLLAVLIPVYFLVFMFGFSNAVIADLFETATRMDIGHLQVRHVEERGMGSALPLMQDADEVVHILDSMPAVEWHTVRLDLPALASSEDRSQSIYVQGVVPEEIGPISNIANLVVDGSYLHQGSDGAVIGQELAEILDIGVGDEFVALSAHPDTGVGVLKLPVIGIYRAPMAEMGRTVVHVTLATARQLARSPDASTAVIARVRGVTGARDLSEIDTVVTDLQGQLPADLEALDWRELAPQLTGYLGILTPALTIIASVFFGLGALVVLNTLYLSVMERTRELGLVLSLGASRWRVIRMILGEASVIAVAGAFYGAVIGVVLIWIVEAFGGIPMPGSAGEFMRILGIRPALHMAIRWPQVILSAVAMAIVAVMAAWFPAHRASRLEPVEAMRYVE